MDRETFTFNLVDKYPPDIVIKESLMQIEEATNGYVMGIIEKYDGPITSYTRTEPQNNLFTAFAGLQTSKTIDVNIQDILGVQNDEQNRFEVFLKVKNLEHYKYRMMFVDYNDISYPVTIVLNEELAVAYSGKRNDRFIVKSMKELEDMVDTIINMDIMISLIQNLINEALRQEAQVGVL